MSEPLVSVVVSTRERPDRLARMLAGLRDQTLPGEQFEVVVVDDGSGPETATVLARELSAGRLALTGLRNEQPLGPGPGRNRGWRAARAPLVAFTDDDCVPAPGWLRAGLDAVAAHPGAIIQGRTEPDPSELGGRSLTARTVSVTGLAAQYQTCNMFYPRSLLEDLDGFNEAFGLRMCGEDTELAWRALGRGAPVAFAPDALVHHAVRELGWLGTLRDAARWEEGARLLALQPRARGEILYAGMFWNVWHYLLLRSALAHLVAPAWLRRQLLRRHGRALRERARAQGSGSWAVPYLIVHDAIETAAVIRGAVRYRTLVL